MGAILGFLKSLYEHKEKIVLAALVIAFIGVGYFKWWKVRGSEPGPKGRQTEIPTVDGKPPEVVNYSITRIDNSVPLDTQLAMTDDRIFKKPEIDGATSEEQKAAEWPTIKIISIFDATKSGNFIAIMEINGKREFKKEGQVFLDHYDIRRIDGVRKCLTIVKRGSKGGEEEKEFCMED